MAGRETTPLLQKKGDNKTYYFKKIEKKGSSFQATSDGDGGRVVETLPAGSTEEDFAPRTLGAPSKKNEQRPGFFELVFGIKEVKDKSATQTRMVKPRKAPIKIEPKVFFANERTFLAWMHVSVILAGASVAILALSDYENIGKQVYGLIMLPVAVSFLLYSMYQYVKRSYMIRHKLPGPYDDSVGPTVLGVMLMVSISAQFIIKLMSIDVL